MNLIIGSSGYLATNLKEYLDPSQTIEISRSHIESNSFKNICLDFRNQLTLDDIENILSYEIKDIYILGRPVESDFYANKTFYDNLKWLFLELIDRFSPRSIHFFSTTLVYDGIDRVKLSASTIVKPYSFYEYFKLDFELFLQYLSLNFGEDVAIHIYRLPLLFDGKFSWKKNSDQFIYYFIDSYTQSNGWAFKTDKDKQYGTSWLSTSDLCQLITTNRNKPGFYLKNASSGFFTYFELNQILSDYFGNPKNNELKLYHSYFRIDDELGVPPRDIKTSLLNLDISKLIDEKLIV